MEPFNWETDGRNIPDDSTRRGRISKPTKCRNGYCGVPLTDADKRSGVRCHACANYLHQTGIERPRALIERAKQRKLERSVR